jgi:thiol-disulfide isomerase/thioredoxin
MTTVILLLLLSSITLKAQITPLAAGDKCPEQLLSHLKNLIIKSQYPNNARQAILIDFWATWCSPCVSALPSIDSLQQKYQDKFTVLSVLEKDDNRVPEVLMRVFGKKGSKLTFVDKDTILKSYFPHQTIPHYVWIDHQGEVKLITNQEQTVLTNIIGLINQDPSLIIKSKALTKLYDTSLPLYASKQATLKDELLYQSLITKWREDFNTGYSRGDNYISCLNSPILDLFQIAFGKFDLQFLDINRIELEGFKTRADSAKLGIFTSDALKKLWKQSKEKYGYSYELVVPDSTYTFDQLFGIMQQDINRFFYKDGLTGRIEKRTKKVIALSYISNKQSPAFLTSNEKPGHYTTETFIKMVNEPVSFFLSMLSPYLKHVHYPLYNDTGYKGVVNIEINNTSTIQSINAALVNYGIVLKEKEVPLEIIIISKSK